MDDINKKIQDLIELRNIQGRKGNYDYDDFMRYKALPIQNIRYKLITI